MKIHVTKQFDWNGSDNVTYCHSAGYTIEVDEDCSAYAVSKGYALIADIAEDDLFQRADPNEIEEARNDVQAIHDAVLDDDAADHA